MVCISYIFYCALQRAGHLAKVQCLEVRCEMTAEFYHAYLREANQKRSIVCNGRIIYRNFCSPHFYILSNRRKLLCVMNPNKFRSCEFLIRQHEERNDKVLVFWYVYILFNIGCCKISPIYRFVFIFVAATTCFLFWTLRIVLTSQLFMAKRLMMNANQVFIASKMIQTSIHSSSPRCQYPLNVYGAYLTESRSSL